MDIHEYYRQAGNFHGHWCPGLAIGVRAAFEAGQALGTQMADRHNHIQCLAESSACWTGYSLCWAPPWATAP